MSSYAAGALVPLTISTALAVSLLVASWPSDVEAAVFGLGGDAAQAARSVATGAASWQADRIYFGGQDGRSLNVAYMPGLRYREMKWAALQGGSLDSAVQVWPAPGLRGLLVPPPGASPPSRWDCVEPGGAQGLAPVEKSALALLPVQDGGPCTAGNRRLASFSGLLTLLAAGHATMPTTDQPAVRAAWRVQQRPSFRVLPVVEALDPSGRVIDRAVAEPYPAGSWEPGEVVVAYLALPSTNRPGARLAIAFARGGAEQRLAIDDPLPLFGQTRFLIEG
jgi:hypothetical protein